MIRIKKINSYFPKSYLSLKKNFKNIEKRFLEQKIGASKVLRKNNENVVDMCVKAFLNSKIKVNKKIKLIILCTQNPDYHGLPHNSAMIQSRLGLDKNVACLDVSQGCAGYLYGLKIADSFLKDNELALFFTCDPYSKIIKKKDYNTELLFGDASTMTVIQKTNKKKYNNLLFSDFYTDGKHYQSIINRGGTLEMNGKNVMEFCSSVVPKFIISFLKKNSVKLEHLDAVYLHQGSKHVVDTIYKKLGVAEHQRIEIIKDIGNTVSSSIPILLEKNYLLNKRKKILICGFGVGLSISVGIIE
tara:strand:+ start:126 stop:1028 length:903 start_codon:yes stop_codon:yes gene_type:complete